MREDLPFDLDVVDIDADPGLVARYRTEVPVVLIDGAAAFRYRVDADELRQRLLVGVPS